MYPQFFGFDKLPFRLRPDAAFLYAGAEYARARATVLAGLQGAARLVVLTGPAGVGKTTLLEDVLGELKNRHTLCRINQPHISAHELLDALLLQMGAPSIDTGAKGPQLFVELAAAIQETSSRNRPPLLIVDDAQLLAPGTLQTFAELLHREPGLRLLLVTHDGQEQRLGVLGSCTAAHLHALTAGEVKAYIERRLAVAGAHGREIFSRDAYAMVYQHTGGAPRLVNVLCDAALHAACARAAGQVSSAEVLVATQDPRWPEAVARHRPKASPPAEEPSVVSAQFLVSLDEQEVAVWPIRAGRVSIGRAPDNELRLDASFISRHHCQVVTIGNVSTIEDLGSVNGICVNGKTVRRHVLQHADRITLGKHMLTYRVIDEVPARLARC